MACAQYYVLPLTSKMRRKDLIVEWVSHPPQSTPVDKVP